MKPLSTLVDPSMLLHIVQPDLVKHQYAEFTSKVYWPMLTNIMQYLVYFLCCIMYNGNNLSSVSFWKLGLRS